MWKNILTVLTVGKIIRSLQAINERFIFLHDGEKDPENIWKKSFLMVRHRLTHLKSIAMKLLFIVIGKSEKFTNVLTDKIFWLMEKSWRYNVATFRISSS